MLAVRLFRPAADHAGEKMTVFIWCKACETPKSKADEQVLPIVSGFHSTHVVRRVSLECGHVAEVKTG